ncbi:MAG: SDR family oxidoreductase [Candidatus Rokuibacteriota bacterium]
MRALVIGASGQVGAALHARLAARGHSVIGTHDRVPQPSTRPLQITDAAATEKLIAETASDWVFCPAGLTHVDYCEDHPDEAVRVNCDGPAVAARAAARRRAGFVYYSTEYIFDGRSGPYAEDDPPHPISVYGRSKLEGERAVSDANPHALVLRTTVVYGPEPQGKNFVYRLVRQARTGERVTVPADQRSSPTYNQDLAAAVVELAERGVSGVLHVAGPMVLDRHAFALVACDVFGLDRSLMVPVATAELGQRAARPLNAGLRVNRARALLTVGLLGPREGLTAMRKAVERAGAGGGSVDTPAAPL